MAHREEQITRSIQHAILQRNDTAATWTDRVSGHFNAYWLNMECVKPDLFHELRTAWTLEDSEYLQSFRSENAENNPLSSMGDMGYSGSTFFSTNDFRYLIKSVPRHFEHSFFKDDMLEPYAEHMQNQPYSLLIRITDFLEYSQRSVGSAVGLAPSHHIIMENLLHGQPQGENSKWESWDLKPMSYFYPERDVAGGALSSEATKSRLADDFDENIVLGLDQAEHFKGQLEKDTMLLQRCGAVDYSLFLVRMPAQTAVIAPGKGDESWRTGVKSADGMHIYRAAILDFFWAKHKVHAKMMTGLIKSYNLLDRQGPMSVTTTPEEYRTTFLDMCRECLEVRK